MSHTGDRAPVPLELHRTRVIDILCKQMAGDAITMEEFERRVEEAHRATSLAALDDVIRDLTQATAPAPEPALRQPVEPVHRRKSELMAAIMGGVTRRGPWTPARLTRIVALMGGAELDFREAEIGSGITEVSVAAIMGGVEIIVPPGLAVECNGIGIMGGFEHHASGARRPDDTTPLLRINGVALMGGVEVHVRLPGESAAAARRRKREEQKALRKELKQLQRSNRGSKE